MAAIDAELLAAAAIIPLLEECVRAADGLVACALGGDARTDTTGEGEETATMGGGEDTTGAADAAGASGVPEASKPGSAKGSMNAAAVSAKNVGGLNVLMRCAGEIRADTGGVAGDSDADDI